MQHRPMMTKTPQANEACERMQQAIGNSLWILRQWISPTGIDNAKQLVNTALANAMYTMRAFFPSLESISLHAQWLPSRHDVQHSFCCDFKSLSCENINSS
jgi:hypothetical protein